MRSTDRPNLVLVVLDTTRADALLAPDGLPAIADLRGRGMTFTRALSAAPWTLPSTGRCSAASCRSSTA